MIWLLWRIIDETADSPPRAGVKMLFAPLKSQLPERAGSEEKEEAELGIKPDADVSDQK